MLSFAITLLISTLVPRAVCFPIDEAGSSPPYSHVVRLDRRSFRQRPPVHNGGGIRVFDQTYAQKEFQGVLAKYQKAAHFLHGIGLQPEQDITAYYPPLHAAFQNISANSFHAQQPSEDAIIPPIDVPTTTTAAMHLKDLMSGTLDILYYGPMQFGTPPQELMVDIDTGSADLWVPANCGECTNKQLDTAMSSTYTDWDQEFQVSYGAGEVSGTIATDVVSVHGLTISNQTFGAIYELSEDFNSYPNSGLLGLAFGTIAQSKKATFFERLIQEKKLAAPLFSVHLARNQEVGSEVCFGCFDPSKTRGTIKWVPVKSKTYWSVAMDGLAINSTIIGTNDLIAAIDTGTTLIYLPDRIAAQFYGAIRGAKPAAKYGPEFYTYPCSSPLSISFSFGGQLFGLNMFDFNLGMTGVDSTECVGGILSLGDGFPSNLAIIGDEFLKSWYTTFDYSNNGRIGFAPSVNNEK